MNKRFLSLLFAGVVVIALPAQAQTLEEAMAAAYAANPGLQAQRAKLRAVHEGVDEARSGWRPSIDAVAGAGTAREAIANDVTYPTAKDLNPRDVGIKVTQPVFRGFRTVSAVRAAQAQEDAQAALLGAAEQDLLLEAAKAYLDVAQAQKVLALMRANEDVLQKEADATQARFAVGEVTKTDISQAQARLNLARAQRIQAEGDLSIRQATYTRLMGTPAMDLEEPKIVFDQAQSVEEALDLAAKNHPLIRAGDQARQAAKENITQARGALLPEVSLVAAASRGWDQTIMQPDRQDSAALMARVTIPLYRAGADYAKTRAANETAVQKGLELDDVRAKVREGVIAAWQALATARAAIAADQAAVDAAGLALHGVHQESKVGQRTVLDILNAQQEQFAAQVQLVKDRHDEALATLQLMASTGCLRRVVN